MDEESKGVMYVTNTLMANHDGSPELTHRAQERVHPADSTPRRTRRNSLADGFVASLAFLTFRPTSASVDSAIALAEAFDVMYTPTLLMNGWRFEAPPSHEDLRDAIRAVLDGRKFPEAKLRQSN